MKQPQDEFSLITKCEGGGGRRRGAGNKEGEPLLSVETNTKSCWDINSVLN